MPEDSDSGGATPRPLDHRQLADLARSMEEGDPIDWAGLDLDPALAYDMMASQVAEMVRDAATGDEGDALRRQLAVALASSVKLLVENFVLNHRLMRSQRDLRLARTRLDRLGAGRN